LKKIFIFLVVALMWSVVSPLAQPAQVVASPIQQASPVNCYLPFAVAKGECIPQSYESPFSLQIAAEHQLAAPGSSFSVQSVQAQAEAQAKIEASYAFLSQALVDSGAGWTRLFLQWSKIEPNAPVEGQDPVYSWTYYDGKYAIVANTGLKMIITIANSPNWAAALPCRPVNSDRLDEYARFLTDLVNHYKVAPYNVKYWEIVNEPDYSYDNGYLGGLGCMGFKDEKNGINYALGYKDMLATAYTAIKAADPEATVLMGGIAHDWFIEYGGPFRRDFPDDVMNAGGGSYTDTLTLHYFPDFHAEWERWDPSSPDRRYGWIPAPTCGDVLDGVGQQYEAYGIDVIAKVTHYRNRMKTCYGVDRPVWLTELAEHGYANKPESLDTQARYIIQGHARALAAGVTNITWYALVTVNDYYEQGLLFDDWSPKPAFTSYQVMTSELKNYRYAETRAFPGGELYVFKDSCGNEKLATWNGGNRLVFAASRVRTINYLGVETFIDDGGVGDQDGQVNQSVSLLVTDPIFAEIDTASP